MKTLLQISFNQIHLIFTSAGTILAVTEEKYVLISSFKAESSAEVRGDQLISGFLEAQNFTNVNKFLHGLPMGRYNSVANYLSRNKFSCSKS